MSPDDILELMEPRRHGDFPAAVLEYATTHPEDPRWKDFVRQQLVARTDDAGRYLNMLTLFPGLGLFLEPEVLELTDDGSYHIRAWAVEVLVCWAQDHKYRPADPKTWAGHLRRRAAEECHDFIVRDSIRESAQHLLAWIGEPESCNDGISKR